MIEVLRKEYHSSIYQNLLSFSTSEKPSNADANSDQSLEIATLLAKNIKHNLHENNQGQSKKIKFVDAPRLFLEQAFHLLSHLRPGAWNFTYDETKMEQIILNRLPISDDEIDGNQNIFGHSTRIATATPLRQRNSSKVILYAVLNCIFIVPKRRNVAISEIPTLLRHYTEKHLNLIVTAEPLPTRIATFALGTGDIDCVYHFALPELKTAIENINNQDQLDMLMMMIEGRRLRDISDLPFDLAI